MPHMTDKNLELWFLTTPFTCSLLRSIATGWEVFILTITPLEFHGAATVTISLHLVCTLFWGSEIEFPVQAFGSLDSLYPRYINNGTVVNIGYSTPTGNFFVNLVR